MNGAMNIEKTYMYNCTLPNFYGFTDNILLTYCKEDFSSDFSPHYNERGGDSYVPHNISETVQFDTKIVF